MNYLKRIMFISFIICSLEMYMCHHMIKSSHAWDTISLIMNSIFYLIIFVFSYSLLLLLLRFYKKTILIYSVHFLPYVLISLYYIFIAMPGYVNYDINNLLLFPFFPILVGVLTFFYIKIMLEEENLKSIKTIV